MEKQDIRKIKTCEKCKNSVEINKIKFYPKNKEEFMIICENCLNDLKSKTPTKKTRNNLFTENRTSKPMIQEQKPVKIIKQVSGKTSYICGRCNYSFKVDENKKYFTDPKCPYCGKADKLRIK